MTRIATPDQRAPALAYFRTREGGPSLDEQERRVAMAAEAHGFTVSNRLIEVAQIGTCDMTDRRVKLFELLAEAQGGSARTVVIGGADAIGENPVEAAIVAVMLERSGCRVLFGDGFDPSLHSEQADRIIAGEFELPG